MAWGGYLADPTLTFLKADLNPICLFQVLLGAHHIIHVSRIRVKLRTPNYDNYITYFCIWLYSAVYPSTSTQCIQTGSRWKFSAVTNLKGIIGMVLMRLKDISSWLTHIVIRCSHAVEIMFLWPTCNTQETTARAEYRQLREMILFVKLGQVPIYIWPHPRSTNLLRYLVRGILGNRFAKIVRDSTLRSSVSFN